MVLHHLIHPLDRQPYCQEELRVLRPIRACSWASSLARAVIWAQISLDSGPRQVFSGNEVRREPRRPLIAYTIVSYHISTPGRCALRSLRNSDLSFSPVMGLLSHFPVDRL